MQHTVIVGGSSGIGLSAAQHLLAVGHRVTITGRGSDRLAAAKAAVPGVSAVVMDATKPDFSAIGALDHLVLALGSNKGMAPFATADLANVKASFEEKVFAHYATAQAALPHLRTGGSITFVAAVSAHAAMPGTSGIGAANAAITALVPILAVELKPTRVNAVSPGVIDTPWWTNVPADQKKAIFTELVNKTPVGRVGTADDIAQAIWFLTECTFMNGHTIICDGGLRLTL
ncbi:MAG TPA: SDR family oxidoreductase [Kofleriaceae bacterium]|jgi:NAD(P)-dependent dehydrogenase (short-subunit alcohol dehydrogenase family)